MVVKTRKQTNSVIDNSKNIQVITHSLYLVANPKTGKIKQECRIEKENMLITELLNKITYMTNKRELALEIEHLKQQLRERERESRIMKWCFLMVDFVLTGISL